MLDVPFLLFSQRRRIADLYRMWCRNNLIKDCPETMIAFLQENNLIDKGNALQFIESKKGVNTNV